METPQQGKYYVTLVELGGTTRYLTKSGWTVDREKAVPYSQRSAVRLMNRYPLYTSRNERRGIEAVDHDVVIDPRVQDDMVVSV